MKPISLEWIDKAEADWNVEQMSYRARKHSSYDAAVFHARQGAEKYPNASWKRQRLPSREHMT